ncbi:MAG: YciI family protein [Burkholderiales bacterium]
MKYLCLVYYDESRVYDRMSSADWKGLVSQCLAYGADVRGSGHFVDGAALLPTKTAKTVRVRDGRAAVTDGPFAETKEQLAGFYLFEARDLNEAIQVASRIPPARLGSIEVRPVRDDRAAGAA